MKYTEAKIKKAAASRYMNEDQLEFFRERLINMKIELRQHLENERSELPSFAKLIIIFFPSGENLGANVIPGKSPTTSWIPVSISNK